MTAARALLSALWFAAAAALPGLWIVARVSRLPDRFYLQWVTSNSVVVWCFTIPVIVAAVAGLIAGRAFADRTGRLSTAGALARGLGIGSAVTLVTVLAALAVRSGGGRFVELRERPSIRAPLRSVPTWVLADRGVRLAAAAHPLVAEVAGLLLCLLVRRAPAATSWARDRSRAALIRFGPTLARGLERGATKGVPEVADLSVAITDPNRLVAGAAFALSSVPFFGLGAVLMATSPRRVPVTDWLWLAVLPLLSGACGFMAGAALRAPRKVPALSAAVRGGAIGLFSAALYFLVLTPLGDIRRGPGIQEYEFAMARMIWFGGIIVVPALWFQAVMGALVGCVLAGFPRNAWNREGDPPPGVTPLLGGSELDGTQGTEARAFVQAVQCGVGTFAVGTVVAFTMAYFAGGRLGFESILPLAVPLAGLGGLMARALGHMTARRLSREGVVLAALCYLLPGLLLWTAAWIAGALGPGAKAPGPVMPTIILIFLYVASGALLDARPPRSVRRAFWALSALPLALATYAIWVLGQ